MERIVDEVALAAWLQQLQVGGVPHGKCLLKASFAARFTDEQLRSCVDLMLQRTQRRAYQLHRQRDGSLQMGISLSLREGVQMMHQAESELSCREQAALAKAREMAHQAGEITDERARFRHLFGALARHAQYENHRPGTADHARVVGACGALLEGRANCQGFADAYWLVCTLAGLTADYQLGHAGSGTHAWNLIRIGESWYAADVSRASRLLRTEGEDAMERTFALDAHAAHVLGLRWDPALAIHAIEVVLER